MLGLQDGTSKSKHEPGSLEPTCEAGERMAKLEMQAKETEAARKQAEVTGGSDG